MISFFLVTLTITVQINTLSQHSKQNTVFTKHCLTVYFLNFWLFGMFFCKLYHVLLPLNIYIIGSCPVKWCLRNEHRNSFFANCDYQNLGSASDWLCGEENLFEAIKRTTQIWAVTRHQYGISVISIDFLQLFHRNHF